MREQQKAKTQLIKEIQLLRKELDEIKQKKIFREFEMSRNAALNLLEDLKNEVEERKRIEERLHENEQRLSLALECTGIGLWDQDCQNGHVYRSREWAEMLGYTLDEVEEGLDFWKSLVHPEDWPRVNKAIHDHETCKTEMFNVEHRLRTKSGHYKWIRNWGKVIERDPKGKPVRALGLHVDIDEKKQAEYQLIISEQRFRSLIENTTDALFCYEFRPPISTSLPIKKQVRKMYDCELAECNDVCAESYGFKCAEEVIGKKFMNLFGAVPGSLDKLFTDLVICGYRIVDGEGVENLEDGSKRYFLNNAFGVIQNGKLLRIWGSFRDITERHYMEEALRHERDLLKNITETSPIGITVVNADGQITFANKRAEEILHLSKDNITQRTYNASEWHITDYNGKPFPDNKLPFCQVKKTSKPVFDVKHAIKWSDGRRRLLSINAAPLFDSEGRFESMVASIEDITEERCNQKG